MPNTPPFYYKQHPPTSSLPLCKYNSSSINVPYTSVQSSADGNIMHILYIFHEWFMSNCRLVVTKWVLTKQLSHHIKRLAKTILKPSAKFTSHKLMSTVQAINHESAWCSKKVFSIHISAMSGVKSSYYNLWFLSMAELTGVLSHN